MADWRLSADQEGLRDRTLWRRRYAPASEFWTHDHCAFCWAEFATGDGPDAEHEGYATTAAAAEAKADESELVQWICARCFADFHDQFGWRVVEE